MTGHLARDDSGASMIIMLVATSGVMLLLTALFTYAATAVTNEKHSANHIGSYVEGNEPMADSVYAVDGALKVALNRLRTAPDDVVAGESCPSTQLDLRADTAADVTVNCGIEGTPDGYVATATNAGPGVSLAAVSLNVHPGKPGVAVPKIIRAPFLPVGKPDIVFLADTTHGMQAALTSVKNSASDILNVMADQDEPRYGVAEYRDFTSAQQWNGKPFRFDSMLNPLDSSVASSSRAYAGIQQWTEEPTDNLDQPEAGLYALHRVVAETPWRAGSDRFVVWFGDRPSNWVCARLAGTTGDLKQAGILSEMQAKGIKVIAVSVSAGVSNGNNDGLNLPVTGNEYKGATLCGNNYKSSADPGIGPDLQDKNFAIDLVSAVGGISISRVDPTQVATEIRKALTKFKPVLVTAQLSGAGCTSMDVRINGSTADSWPGAMTGEDGTLDLTETIAAPLSSSGTATCTVNFLVNGELLPAGYGNFSEINTVTFVTTTKVFFTALDSGSGRPLGRMSATYTTNASGTRSVATDSWTLLCPPACT
jgi:hypothetical protein